jgi:cytochrome c-type biogenesis protein CcmH/NrfF
MLTGLLKQLALAAAKAAVEKAVAAFKKKQVKDKAQSQWANTVNEPWGCTRCQNLNYLGGGVCMKCGWPKP